MNKKLLLVFLLFSCFAKSQLIVNNTIKTPAQLVQNVLVDPSVTPTNIKFNRSLPAATAVRDQAAEFSSNFNPTGLGLDRGILLTTGKATVALGPNANGGVEDATVIPVTGDPDLALLSGQNINNVALLEFDFVATGLILNFDYVFASEEYPEWTSSIFNDVFGFFLSGPGLAGPYSGGAINIALIPTTTTASNVVSIANVNNGIANAGPCRNCLYYVNNTIAATPQNLSIQYDGFTVPLRATAPLICGQTYHIKLAIANAGSLGDNLFDSGVFIKNFRIQPLVLRDNFGLDNNPGVCFGENVTISSGLTPSGNIYKWYQDGVLLPLETGPDLNVTAAGVYTFEEYTPSLCRIAVDDITIGFLPPIAATPPLDLTLCTSAPGPYQFNIDQTSLMTSTLNPADFIITYYNTNAGNEATNGSASGIIPDTDLSTYTIATSSATIWVRFEDVNTGCVLVESFDLNVIPSPSGSISFGPSPYCNNLATPQAITTTSLTPGGVFSVTPAGLVIDPATGAITPFGSPAIVYTVKYEIAATASCPLYSTTTPVTLQACSCTVIASSALEAPCINSAMTPITYSTIAGITGITLTSGSLPPGVSGNLSAGVYTISGTPNTSGTYIFTYEITSGGIDTCFVTTTIDVLPPPNAGVDGSTVVCDDSTAVINLFDLITGEQSGGTWTRLPGGTGGTFNAAAGTFTPAAGATTSTFEYRIAGVAPCVDDFSIATITINAAPNAGSNGNTTVCDSSSAAINLFNLITGEQAGGTWTRLTGGTTGTFNAAAGTFTPAPGALTSTFQYEVAGVAPCSNATSVATVNINAQPNAGADGSTLVCDDSTAVINLFNLITGEQSGGTWTRLPGGTGGTFNAAAGTFTPAAGATSSTFEYRITGVAPCVDDFSIATVNINAQPVAGTNGNTTVCDTDITPINLFNLITGEQAGGTWTRLPGGIGGTFNAAAGTFTPAPGATTSPFQYEVAGVAPCSNATSVATVNINAQPDAGADGSTLVCDNSSIAINLFNLITGEQSGGTWIRLPGGTGGTFDPLAGTFTPAAGATSSTFEYRITGVAPCVDDFSIATVNINAQPTAGTNGNTTICDNDITPVDLFSLITGEQAGGTWTRLPGGTGGTFNAAAGTFASALGSTTSTFQYELTAVAPCVNATSVAIVNINAQPDAGIDGSVVVCDSSTAVINLFNLITGEQPGGTWTRLPGGTGGTFDPIAATYIPASGSTTSAFEYRIAGVAPCIDDISIATVTINAQPDAGTSGSVIVCDNDSTPVDLFGLITSEQAGGVWTQLPGGSGGTFNAAAGTFTSASGAITSTFKYELTGIAPCINSSSTATVNINAQPDAGVSGGITICDTDTTVIDLFSLITAEQPGGSWTQLPGGSGGTFNAAAGTFTAAIGATTSRFEYRLPGVAPCVDATSIATVTINAQPNSGVANPPLLVCSDSTTPIDLFSLITGEQAGGTWIRFLGSGGIFDPIAGTFTPTPTTINIPNVFAYSIIATPPCLDVSTQVNIDVIAAPKAGVDGVTTICDSSTAPIDLNTLITGEQSGGTWSRNTGSGGTLTPGGIYTPAPGALSGTFIYTVNGLAPCGNDTSVATVNINAQPDAGVNGLPKVVCDNDTTAIDLFSLINGEQAGGTWIRSSGTGGTFDATTARFTPAPGATNSTFTYTIIGTAPCIDSSSVATININAQPIAGVDGTIAVCDSSTTAIDLFSLITSEQSGGVWTRIGGLGGTFDAVLGTFTPALGATNSTFVYTLSGVLPCTNDTSQATVNISAQPNAGVAGSTSICDSSATPIDLFGLIIGEQAGGTWSRSSGTGGLFNAASGSFTPSAGSTTSTFTYTIPGVAPCVNASSVATVNINNQPNAGVGVPPQIICESATTTVDLFSLIIGEEPGGVWSRSSGTGGVFNALAGTFVPTVGATSSTFTYTLTGTAPCVTATSLASVTILPVASITLTAGVSVQTLCINNNITPFSYTIGNLATGASITSGGLPLGVNPIFTAGVLTISGTALESGTFNFVVSTTGGCSSSSLSGVLVVRPEVRLILSSTPSTTFQSACINEPIDIITYRTENNPTSVSVTGLPPGVTGVYTGGLFTISGASSLVGSYPYVVTTVGGCGVDSLNGTITINPNVSITLLTPVATTLQTVCINEPILPITYQVDNGATGASLVAGTVPDGIQGSFNTTTKTFTINGITRESGTFNYIITTSGGCGSASLTGTINVNPLPVINLPQDGFICMDASGNPISDYILTTNLSPAQYSFEWSDINGVIAAETGNSYTATVPGPYSVKVTNLLTGCQDTQNATITASLAPSAMTISQTTYFEDGQVVTVRVSPPGDYLYQLDSGPFQGNNFFVTFVSGTHTITVKDKFGCGFKQDTFTIVNYPKFFTPNGDGFNDTWNIFEIADQPQAFIYIFDRYGKLLKQIATQGEGWDGTYNGADLPGDDYWFKVFYKEKGQDKEFRAHFSLKR